MDTDILHPPHTNQINDPTRRMDADAQWDAFISGHPAPHILQTRQWGALKSQFGWSSERVVLPGADSGIAAGALLLFRTLIGKGRVGLTMAYAPKGPLVDWEDRAQTEALLTRMEACGRARGASILKIEPELPDTPQNRALLQSYGFQPSVQAIQPRSTLVLDIGDSEDAILKRMKSKWRYNVRLARRKKVVVREGARADLAHFDALMQTTGQRKEFAVHSAAYYATAFDLFVPGQAAFLFAEYEGTPLAALAVFALGDTAWYLWGASSNRERNRMPNHALQWAAIQWARQRGATRYDLWGIPDDVGKVAVGVDPHSCVGVPAADLPIDLNQTPHNEMWGVYRLKQGFGGNVVRFVGAWDKPLHPVGFQIYQAGFRLQERARVVQADALDQIDSLRQRVARSASPKTPSPKPQRPRFTCTAIYTAAEWRARLSQWPHAHVLQSWEWGAVKAQTGWFAERYALQDAAGQTCAAFQILWRRPVSMLPVELAYIPKGPLLNWEDDVLVDAVLDQIQRLVRARGGLFVKIDPDVSADTPHGRKLLRKLAQRGWRFSGEQIQFQNTAFSELLPHESDGEARLLAGMKSKWRYNIRLAGRRGIRVREGTPEDFRTFYALYAETGQRDGFLIRPFGYYRTVWQTFLDAQSQAANPAGGVLLLAEHEDEDAPVAGIFLLRYDASCWYFYGASSERRRRDMPNYLLQWEAMRWARQQGCTRYDWWGAPTDLADESDAMQGVWRFKQGFGAVHQPHIGAWDWPVSAPLYDLYTEAAPRLLALMRRLAAA